MSVDNEKNVNVSLEQKDCITDLGVISDENMSRKNHIASVATKMSKTIRFISKLR